MIHRRRLGRTEINASVIGIGGFLGALDDPGASRSDREAAAINAVRRAVDLDVNYFDTSPSYGDGERHLGLGLKDLGREERASLFVATKVGTHPQRPHQYDSDSIRWSLEQSFQVLFSDRFDVVLIHDPRSDEDFKQAMDPGGALEALERLKSVGAIGAIGLGVQSHRFLRKAIESGRFDVILSPYDYTLVRDSARSVIDLGAERDVGVINGSPYAAGLLAGIDPDEAALRRSPSSQKDLDRARELWKWCQDRELDLGIVAMQYSLRNENIAVTLVGPRTAEEVESNVRHATEDLPTVDWDELEEFIKGLEPPGPGGESFPAGG